MLNIETSALSAFVKNFINTSLYSDMTDKEREELESYLIEVLKQLYQENPKNVINVINQSKTISPFIFVLAMGYGILEEDVVTISKILFMKINEFFYKKGSLDTIKNILNILNYFGIQGSVEKVIYNKASDSYVLEDIFSGERRAADNDEYITPGHLVTRETYALNTFANNYDTIIINIDLSMSPQVNKKMQQPVAILHAYAISKYRHKSISMMVNENMYDMNLEEYLFFLEYYYLKYIKIKYPDFDIDNGGMEAWNLFLTDNNDMLVAEKLVNLLISGEYASRDGVAYFERVSAMILNKYKIKTSKVDLSSIETRAHKVNSRLATDIDNLITPEEYVNNITMNISYMENFLASIPASSDLDHIVVNTLHYLFMFVTLAIISDYRARIADAILTYKRYFMPIYTQFYFNNDKSFIFRNEYLRLYTDEKLVNYLSTSARQNILYIRDEQRVIPTPIKRDEMLFEDSLHSLIDSRWLDSYEIEDKNLIQLMHHATGLIYEQDETKNRTEIEKRDYNSILDSVTITVTNES